MNAIRFPRMHIASSVVNRIMNLAQSVPPAITPAAMPDVPDASKQGEQLDQALAQQPGPMAAPEDAEAVAAASALNGGSAAEALGTNGIIEELSP